MKTKEKYFGFETRKEVCPECGHALAWRLMIPKKEKGRAGSKLKTIYHCPECNVRLSESSKLELDQLSTKISLIGAAILILSFLLKFESDNFRFGILIVGCFLMLAGVLIEGVRTRNEIKPLNRWKKTDDT